MSDTNLKIEDLSHNPNSIKKAFINNGDVIMTTREISVVFPERYVDIGLTTISTTVNTLSIYAIVDSDKGIYAVVNTPITIELSPNNIKTILVDGVPYIKLEFGKDEVFAVSRTLLKKETFMQKLYDNFYSKGKIPWYLTMSHVATLYSNAKKYAGSNIGKDPLDFELLTSLITRVDGDPNTYYRTAISSKDDGVKPMYIGLNNIFHSYRDTLAKLAGGYYGMGVSNAITNKEKETSKTSIIYRS